jgi:glycerol uptake facilitator-like aquaporin
MVFCLRRELGMPDAAAYSLAQIAGAVAGVLAAHLMFDQELVQVSAKVRAGPGQWVAETIAAFGLVLVILVSLRVRADAVALNVGLFITAAYWFTASTSFANPAVTIARMLTDTFAGIRPDDAAPFILCQLIGAALALAASRRLTAALR